MIQFTRFIVDAPGGKFVCELRTVIKGETYMVPALAGPSYWSVAQFDSDFPGIVQIHPVHKSVVEGHWLFQETGP